MSKIDALLEAIWPMCRKNELYMVDMFKSDLKASLLKHLLGELPEKKKYLVEGNRDIEFCYNKALTEVTKMLKKELG